LIHEGERGLPSHEEEPHGPAYRRSHKKVAKADALEVSPCRIVRVR